MAKPRRILRITVDMGHQPGVAALSLYDENKTERRFLVLIETLKRLHDGLPKLFSAGVKNFVTHQLSGAASWPKKPTAPSRQWTEVDRADAASAGSIIIGQEIAGERLVMTLKAPDGLELQIADSIESFSEFSKRLQEALEIARNPASSDVH